MRTTLKLTFFAVSMAMLTASLVWQDYGLRNPDYAIYVGERDGVIQYKMADKDYGWIYFTVDAKTRDFDCANVEKCPWIVEENK